MPPVAERRSLSITFRYVVRIKNSKSAAHRASEASPAPPPGSLLLAGVCSRRSSVDFESSSAGEQVVTLPFYLSFFGFASGASDFFCRLTRLIVLLRKAV